MVNNIFLLLINYIHTTHYFRRHSPPFLSISSLPVSLVGKPPQDADPRIELRPAGVQLANALPTELRCTQGLALILKTIFRKCYPWRSEYFKTVFCCLHQNVRNDGSALLKLEPRIYHPHFLGFLCAEGNSSMQNETFLLSIRSKSLYVLNCTRWRCIFEELTQDGDRVKFSKIYSLFTLQSLLTEHLWNDATFSQIKASQWAVTLNTSIDMIIMYIDSDLAECGINQHCFHKRERRREQNTVVDSFVLYPGRANSPTSPLAVIYERKTTLF